MTESLFFYLGMSFLTLHELDAVRCREWRIFPLLSLLDDRWGQPIFLLAHIPLFSWVFLELGPGTPSPQFVRGFDIFMMVHLGLHLLFLLHQKNEFKDVLSWVIIGGAAVCGLLDLVV